MEQSSPGAGSLGLPLFKQNRATMNAEKLQGILKPYYESRMLRNLTRLTNAGRVSKCVLLTSLAVLILVVGCQGPSETDTAKKADQTAQADGPADHTHEPGDELVWESKEKIDGTDMEVWLGHHGSHFHLGDTIEPSVAIMKGGEAFAEAKVFNQLVDTDDTSKTIGDEVATVYEPETEEEIAHYAQGDLIIPADGKGCLVRFRIEIPEAESLTRDMKVNVGH